MYLGTGQIEVLCNPIDGLGGDAAQVFLNLVQKRKKFLAPARKPAQDALQLQS